MTDRPMLAAYWLPWVGMGAANPPPPVLPGPQEVVVPLTDLLNYTRSDGSPQIDVINLMGCTFNTPEAFPNEPLRFEQNLVNALTDGSVKQLQAVGIKVVLTIIGASDSVGWSSIPEAQIPGFIDFLNAEILETGGGRLGLDGIDIDDEYAPTGTTLVQAVAAMHAGFAPGKIISKALWADQQYIPAIKDYLTFGGIMYYGDDPTYLEQVFEDYVSLGLRPDQMTIGINAGPPGGSFTSIATAQALTAWQPSAGIKLGMMVWSFSQDIQQFTADPQNQVALAFPNAADHEWQRAIVAVMEGA